MSTFGLEACRDHLDKIENGFKYVKNKVLEPSKLGRGEDALNTIVTIQKILEDLKNDISERMEITRMNNDLCKKLDDESEMLIKRIQLAHEHLQKKYGFSFEDESQELSEEDIAEAKPFSSFDASPVVAPGQVDGSSNNRLVNGKCRRLNFDEYGSGTPSAASIKKSERNTLTPGLRLLPPSPNFFK